MTKEEIRSKIEQIQDIQRELKYLKKEQRRLQSEIMRGGVKYCPACLRTKEDTSFGANAAHKDGLATYCKDCRREKKVLTMGKVSW